MGGALQLICGKIASSSNNTNEDTGEVTRMVQIQWWGGSHYVVVDPSHDLASLPVGTDLLIGQRQNKGKKGFYADREHDLRILTVGGKPYAQRGVA